MRSGQDLQGTLTVHNTASTPVLLVGSRTKIATVLNEHGAVAGTFAGPIRGAGIRRPLDPGSATDLRVLGGTAGTYSYPTPLGALSDAVPPGRSAPEVLLRSVWSTARSPTAEPVLRLYVEILGQAAAGIAPFPAAARRVALRWLDWVQLRLDVPEAERQDAAAALLATIDGLLLLHLAVGSDVAGSAARRLLPDA